MQLSFRLNDQDLKALSYLIERDVRCLTINEKLKYVIEDAAKICDKMTVDEWRIIKNRETHYLDYIKINKNELSPKTIVVDDKAYETVINSIKKSFGLQKIKISFAIRLCIKLFLDDEPTKIANNSIKEIDGVLLIKKILDLLLEDSDSAKNKIGMIHEILN